MPCITGYCWILDFNGGKEEGSIVGLKRLLGAHSGANQAEIVWDIITDYNLAHSLGYMTLDNAKNNDTALVCLEESMEGLGLDFDSVKRRVRCFGHVINLSVQAFLWGDNAELFARDHAEEEEDRRLDLAAEIASMQE